MVRSRIALWMRGAGAMVAVSAMLTGCVVNGVPEEPEEDVSEDVSESANELDQVTVSGGLEEQTGDSQDPDPVPWRPNVRGSDDPTPDPDSASQVIPAPGPGHNES
jgi:hypothetical protein